MKRARNAGHSGERTCPPKIIVPMEYSVFSMIKPGNPAAHPKQPGTPRSFRTESPGGSRLVQHLFDDLECDAGDHQPGNDSNGGDILPIDSLVTTLLENAGQQFLV